VKVKREDNTNSFGGGQQKNNANHTHKNSDKTYIVA